MLIIASAFLAVILGGATKGPAWLEGIYYDSALAVHALLQAGRLHETEVLVIGLDEASLAHPDLAQRPRALFAPIWAQTLKALRTAGAKVVVFDFILSFSGEKIAPGYDRAFLRELYENRGRMVLGRSQHLLPDRSYSAALGFAPMSLGLSEITPDGDGVFRQVPLMLGDDNNIPTLAGAALTLAGISHFPDKVRLAPLQPADSLPALSVLQVLSCAESDLPALTKAVNGKIVFIGTVLNEEDKKLSASRFFSAGPQGYMAISPNAEIEADTQNCSPRQESKGAANISGVYLHALAADQVLGQRLLGDLNIWLAVMISGVAAALAVTCALDLRPVLAVLAIAVMCLVLWSGEVAALDAGKYAAMGYPSLLSLLFGGGGFVFRFLFEERHRLRIQSAFGHYLAPELVRRLSETEAMPTLGGELREASIMFADLSGFTALSSRLPPQEVVALTNQYLGLMAEEIESSSGYIDKYIGDAVMAIWGAPMAVPDHAQIAVLCAQRIAHRIKHMNAEAVSQGRDGFSVKIGINSGLVIAGNVGAQKRLNYTVVGDTVNVAARLESVPGDYGCMLIIGEQTANLLGDDIVLRELDRIAVKGRAAPLGIFEPLSGTIAARNIVAGYSQALALYRNRDFEAAASQWEKLAESGDRPSSVMAARARQLHNNAPPPDWDGVWHKTAK